MKRLAVLAFLISSSAWAQTISPPPSSPGGASGTLQYNNASSFGGISGWTSNGTTALTGGANTTVAIGGCTIGTDAFCVTGASTITGAVVVSGSSFSLSGNQSAAAWTTAGIRYKNVAATFTDTTSSGTVAAAYTNIFGGSTIAASSATTYTDYFSTYFSDPIAGTNVTLTRKAALGANSIAVGVPAAAAFLQADAANTLALRNGTAAQTFNLYNTYTDGSNYNRFAVGTFSVGASSGRLGLQAQNAGTGGEISLDIGTAGTSAAQINFFTGTTFKWSIANAGHLLAFADNTYDIGASGATRPRDGFFGRNLHANSNLIIDTNGGVLQWAAWGNIKPQSDGIWTFFNAGSTDFGRLQFGGTTSSFPALKRSTTTLAVRLADDSADAPLTAAAITASGAITGNNAQSFIAGANGGNAGQLTLFGSTSGGTQITVGATGLLLITAIPNASTTSALCYGTGTTAISYNSTVGTCTVSVLAAKNLQAPLTPEEGYDIVMAMQPWRYTMKDGPSYVPGEQIGFVADFAKDKRLVAYNEDGSIGGFRYEQYTAALTAAFQYMQARVGVLEARIGSR